MGTVFNRGTKDAPNWYVGYREHGRWVYKPSRQPTRALAKRWVAEIESRIARGQVGIDEPDDAPAFKASFESFLAGLTNRTRTTIAAAASATCSRISAAGSCSRSISPP